MSLVHHETASELPESKSFGPQAWNLYARAVQQLNVGRGLSLANLSEYHHHSLAITKHFLTIT